MDTVIRSSSSLQDASVSGPDLWRQREHFMPCVRTPRCLNGSQQLREPPQNFCCRSRTAGGRRVRGSFLLKPVASGGVSSHPLQHYWSVCPAVSRGVLAEQICAAQLSPGAAGTPGASCWCWVPGCPGPGCRQAVPWDRQCARPSAPRHLGLCLPQT